MTLLVSSPTAHHGAVRVVLTFYGHIFPELGAFELDLEIPVVEMQRIKRKSHEQPKMCQQRNQLDKAKLS